jgi:hypothetical protein
MLNIVISNAKLDLDTSSNLLLTCKESYFSIIQDIPGTFYAEWYEYFPDIVMRFEYCSHKTFYHIMDDADIKLNKLFKILKQLYDIDNNKIKNYRSIIRPLLTNELFISFKNEYTIIFLSVLCQYSLCYPNHYIREYFVFFTANYLTQQNYTKNLLDYIGNWFNFIIIHDQDLNFSFKFILKIKFRKKEKQIIYSIIHCRNTNINTINFGIIYPKIKT